MKNRSTKKPAQVLCLSAIFNTPGAAQRAQAGLSERLLERGRLAGSSVHFSVVEEGHSDEVRLSPVQPGDIAALHAFEPSLVHVWAEPKG